MKNNKEVFFCIQKTGLIRTMLIELLEFHINGNFDRDIVEK